MARWMIAVMLVTISVGAPAQEAIPLFDPATGYRMSNYRGVVDRIPEGVRRIDLAQVDALRGKALLLDVTPAEGAVRDEDGTWRLATPHTTIPGAHWFPESGRGKLAPNINAWFTAGVSRLTHGRRRKSIVVFCLADCWMSWNAALRLRRSGYHHVYWFGEGIDGWRDAGRRLVDMRPSSP